jgi:beta-lactamase regulating signal transducer with metallopeptidase domain/predicted  nucleic acid-binding Zn-ribbon protein
MPVLAPLLFTTLARGTLVLAMALALAAALRRAPGLARHRLWSLAFAGLLLLPALTTVLPPIPLPVPALSGSLVPAMSLATPPAAEQRSGEGNPPGRVSADARVKISARRDGAAASFSSATGDGGPVAEPEAVASKASPAPGSPTSDRWRRLHPSTALFVVWLGGVVLGLAFLAAGIARGVLQTRRARPVDDDGWARDLEWHRNFFGIRRRVRLLESAQVRTPMTGGALRPRVLVPAGAASWSAERRRLVLLHELVHIRRYDVVRHLLTRLGVALYWFNPLAWLAARGSSIAREQACDEEVLRLGVKPSVYATHLLELAQTLDTGCVPAAALPMIQRSQLEKRLMTILDSKARPRASRASAPAAVLMVLTAVSAGVAAPAMEPATAGTAATPATITEALPAATPASLFPSTSSAQATACWPQDRERIRGRFSGTISTDDAAVGRRVNAVGVSDGDRIVQRWVDDLRLCLRASGNVDLHDDGAIGAIGAGGDLILEAELGGRVQNLTIRNDGNGEQMTWTVNGDTRQLTDEVERWRAQMTTVLNEHARIMTLRGQRSSLRGEISSIRGQRSSLRGQISSIRGQRSSLSGQISSIRGRQSSLRGEISSARGHVSSLRGQISSARGHVSSLRGQISTHRSALRGLEASRFGASEEELGVIAAAERRHEEAIEALERQIEDYDLDARVAEIQRQIDDYDLQARIAEIESRMTDDDIEAQVADIEQQIEALDVEGRVAEIERQIEALDVEGKVAEIEREIEALNVDERVREIEVRLEPALRELRSTIESIG